MHGTKEQKQNYHNKQLGLSISLEYFFGFSRVYFLTLFSVLFLVTAFALSEFDTSAWTQVLWPALSAFGLS